MNGILLFNKPVGWTSHDAVDFFRRRLGQKRIGHTGTLDPLATGLLVILLGQATLLSEKLSGLDKEYEGSFTLGMFTDTQDLEGKVLWWDPEPSAGRQQLEEIFKDRIGERDQTPPLYSAVRQGGVHLYELARRGAAVEIKPRKIRIHRFDLLRMDLPEVCFSVHCSKGTYVRTLCEEVGLALGSHGALSSLVRTRVGSMNLSQALTEQNIKTMTLPEIERRLQ